MIDRREDYFQHLCGRLRKDSAASATRERFARIFEGWIDEAIRLNGGVFAWQPRYQWRRRNAA